MSKKTNSIQSKLGKQALPMAEPETKSGHALDKQNIHEAETNLLDVEIPRRSFIQGAASVTFALGSNTAFSANAKKESKPEGKLFRESEPNTAIHFILNGERLQVKVNDNWTLVELLRDYLDLTGTKIGCNRGECGACTVLLNGTPVYACSQLAVWADNKAIRTIEGLSPGGRLNKVQEAFVQNDGAQCGFCTSGQIMTATALLEVNQSPNAEDVKSALAGNLCRCSNYNAIVESVLSSAEGRVVV